MPGFTKIVIVPAVECRVSRKQGIRYLRHWPPVLALVLGLALLFCAAQAQERADSPP
jgi:hypothetical protein